MGTKGVKGLIATLFLMVVLVFSAAPGAEAQDGEYLIFAYDSGNGFDTIQWMIPDAVDTHQPLVTMPGASLNCPRVDSNNKNMAFIDANTGAIYVFEIGVSGPVPIGNSVPAMSLDWSSDGNYIYFWGSDFVFYMMPAVGGPTSPLFAGQVFWSYFNDGGFEVYGLPGEDEADATGRVGSTQDYIVVGAWVESERKINLLQLPVTADPVSPVVVYNGLGDNYTPSRGPVDGRYVWQADHDQAGSHLVYGLNEDGTTSALTDLYSGSPAWNPFQTMFAFAHAGASTYGSTAYSGIIYTRHEATGATVPQFTSGIGRTPSFYGDLVTPDN